MTFDEQRIIILQKEIDYMRRKAPPNTHMFERCIARRMREIEKTKKSLSK